MDNVLNIALNPEDSKILIDVKKSLTEEFGSIKNGLYAFFLLYLKNKESIIPKLKRELEDK